MPAIQIAPSILAADFAAMGQAVREADAAGADAIHVDVMDGQFVPEISFGRQMAAAIRPHTSLPLDVHLMVANPARHVRGFVEAGAHAVTVHLEAFSGVTPLHDALAAIRGAGALAGLALKPATPVSALDEVWDALDAVLVMTVEPGYSGQPFQTAQLAKLEALRERAARRQPAVRLAVDGGVDERTAPQCVASGATFLVAGSSVYSTRRTVAAGMHAIRASLV